MSENIRDLVRKNEQYKKDANRMKLIIALFITVPILGYFGNLVINEIAENMGESLSAQIETIIETNQGTID